MSGLDFVSPYKAKETGEFTPVLHSAMERRLRDAGAQFEVRDGWTVATSVPGQEHHTPGVKDVSNVGKFEIRGDVNGFSAEGCELVPITPERGLVICDYARSADVHEELRRRFLVVDMTGALSGLEISGPGATTVLRRLTEIDLDSLPTTGAAAHLAVTMVRDGDEAYRLYFAQEYGHYFWEVAVDAAEPLGGGPTA
jgi:glycine cleavage system aminomethyltransferase T